MTVLMLVPTENSASANPVSLDFDGFWSQWPRRVSKREAQKAWTKLSRKDKAAAMEALPKHLAYWQACSTEKQFMPHASTWLNQARWEDEIEMPKPQANAARSGMDKAAEPRWWDSWTGLDRKAAELRIDSARCGETFNAYRARIQQAAEDDLKFRRVG